MLILWDIGPWPLWYNEGLMGVTFGFIFLFLRSYQYKTKLQNNSSNLICIFSGIFFFLWIYFRNVSGYVNLAFLSSRLMVLILVILMKDSEKKEIIPLTTKIYAWLVGVPIIFYVLIVFCGVNLPYFMLKHPNPSSHYPLFKNYIVLLINTGMTLFPRYQGFFTEPGHLGTYSAFLLYINKYELKRKEILVILIATLLSLSLAAYVLIATGYFIYKVAERKKVYVKLFVLIMGITLVGGLGLYVSTRYANSIFAQLILNRLQYDESKGIIGNNRTSGDFEIYYRDRFLHSSNFLWGLGIKKFATEIANHDMVASGYKGFLVRYGFIGIICIFAFYGCMVVTSKSRLLLGLFILYGLSFLQRPNFAIGEVEIFFFIGAAALFKYNTTKIRER
jgi:hypothetical protein